MSVEVANKENQDNQINSNKINITKKKPVIAKEVIMVQKQRVDFGVVFPGQICEEELIVIPKVSEPFVVQLLVVCQNNEYDHLDEYVFSARKLTTYDYNDQIIQLLSNKLASQFKVAVKVPNTRQGTLIKGFIQISVLNMQNKPLLGEFIIPILCQVAIPRVLCKRQLKWDEDEVVCVAAKANRQQVCKVPLNNQSNFQMSFDSDFLIKEELPFNMQITNNVVAQPNSQFLVVFQIKPKQGQTQIGEYKQVIVLKVKNSSVYFSFPLLIKIY